MAERIQQVEQFVTGLLKEQLDSRYSYHNLTHTLRVVKSTKEILEATEIKGSDKEVALLAAWFHDTGFSEGGNKGHEERSAQIAGKFLSELGMPHSEIEQVQRLVLATRRFHQPTDFLEQVIRDADSSHFAKESYQETADYLKEELEAWKGEPVSNEDWCELNIEMLQNEHRYYTDYAVEHWGPGKEKNLKALKKERKALKEIAKKEALKAKLKAESPDRSVQTLYRVTLKNHLKLSDIADTKANILLSVNAIIISLLLSSLFPKLDNPSNAHLLVPTLIFVLSSVVSMVLSILATRPNVSSGTFTQKDVEEKKVNLLFFGNFHKMGLPDFEKALDVMTRDQAYIYSSLTKDLYFLGKVLDKKYRLLRLTYTIFMFGMIVSVVAFGLAFAFFGENR